MRDQLKTLFRLHFDSNLKLNAVQEQTTERILKQTIPTTKLSTNKYTNYLNSLLHRRAITSLLSPKVHDVRGYFEAVDIQQTWETVRTLQPSKSWIVWWPDQSGGIRVSADHQINWAHHESFLFKA